MGLHAYARERTVEGLAIAHFVPSTVSDLGASRRERESLRWSENECRPTGITIKGSHAYHPRSRRIACGWVTASNRSADVRGTTSLG